MIRGSFWGKHGKKMDLDVADENLEHLVKQRNYWVIIECIRRLIEFDYFNLLGLP